MEFNSVIATNVQYLIEVQVTYIFETSEKNQNYGFASQTDVDALTETVKKLAAEIEKLNDVLVKQKPKKKK